MAVETPLTTNGSLLTLRHRWRLCAGRVIAVLAELYT
jgi:hypothetical protein